MNEEFKQAIKRHLDKMAAEDEQFAERYAQNGKSLDKCCNYILHQARKRGNAVAMSDKEVYGLAVHYYDEQDIPADECKPVTGGRVSSAPKVELTEEEKAAAKEEAMQLYRERQVREIQREESEKKKREAQKQRERREAFEQRQLSLFDL